MIMRKLMVFIFVAVMRIMRKLCFPKRFSPIITGRSGTPPPLPVYLFKKKL